MQDNIYIQMLKEKLSELNPHLVILFGSHAYGTPHRDSDIDLLVVTEDEYIPQTFKERQKLYLTIGNHILDLLKQVPVDMLVYTLPMYRLLVESDSSFSREILSKGKILYESKNARMA
jgi:predicted nucleotidyltransferase